jgi:hypothetical protein
LPEQRVDLSLRAGRDAQAGVLGEIGALVQAEQQASVQGEEGDRSVGAGDLVVKLLPDDALGRPAETVTVEGNRPAEIVYGQGDEEDLRLHCRSCRDGPAGGRRASVVGKSASRHRQAGRSVDPSPASMHSAGS